MSELERALMKVEVAKSGLDSMVNLANGTEYQLVIEAQVATVKRAMDEI